MFVAIPAGGGVPAAFSVGVCVGGCVWWGLDMRLPGVPMINPCALVLVLLGRDIGSGLGHAVLWLTLRRFAGIGWERAWVER